MAKNIEKKKVTLVTSDEKTAKPLFNVFEKTVNSDNKVLNNTNAKSSDKKKR